MEGGTQCPHAKIRNAQHYSRALESLADRGTQVRGNFIGRILDSLIDVATLLAQIRCTPVYSNYAPSRYLRSCSAL